MADVIADKDRAMVSLCCRMLLLVLCMLSYDFGVQSEDDAKFILISGKQLADPVAHLEASLTVPSVALCHIECNRRSTCTHVTIDDATPLQCDVFNTFDRTSIADVGSKKSYLRVNPPGTMSRDFVQTIVGRTPSGTDIVFLNTNTATNLQMTSVTSRQHCHEICQLITGGYCWVFSYVPGEEKCIVPDYDGRPLSSTRRLEFTEQPYPDAEYFLFNPAVAETETTANFDDNQVMLIENVTFHITTIWDEHSGNLILEGVESHNDCYRICLVTNNNGHCFMFGYDHDALICHIPHDSDTSRNTFTDLYATHLPGFTAHISRQFTSSLGHGVSGTGRIYWSGSAGTVTNNLDILGVGSAESCYTVCLTNNDGLCWLFSYVPDSGRCVVPDDNGNELTSGQIIFYTKEPVENAEYYMFNPAIVQSHSTRDIATENYTVFTDQMLSISPTPVDGPDNLVIDGIADFGECFRICGIVNSGNCFFFSFNDTTGTCHVPYDSAPSRTTLVDLYATHSPGFKAYFMRDLNVPTFDTDYSKLDLIYWNTAIDDIDDNLELTEVVSLQECYVACQLNNDGLCWIFSFVNETGQCVIPDHNGVVPLDYNVRTNFIQQSLTGAHCYFFMEDMVLRETDAVLDDVTTLPQTLFTNLTLYITPTWKDDNLNLLMSGVVSVGNCYKICLITNNQFCFVFSYNPETSECYVPHDSVNTRTTMLGLYGESNPDFISYIMRNLSVPDFTTAHSGENIAYWKGTTAGDQTTNLYITGVVSLQECYVACQLNNDGSCWLFSYHEDSEICVVPDNGDTALSSSVRTTNFYREPSTGFKYYMFMEDVVTIETAGADEILELPNTTFTDLVLYITTEWNNDASNLLMTGVTTLQHCYRICLITNSGTCNLFSYNSDTTECHVPHDSPTARTTLVDLYGQSSVGFTSYFMTDLSVPNLTIGYSGENYVYWKTSSSSPVDNLDITGIVSVQECYTACKLNNDDNCWLFSYDPINERCVVPDDDGAALTFDKRDDFEKQNVPGFKYYLFPVEEVAQDTINVTTIPQTTFTDLVLYIGGTWDDDVSNLLMTGVDTVEHCYRICLITNGGTCYLFSYNAVDDKCHIPHDSPTSRTTLVDLYGQSSVGFTSYFMTDLSVPNLTIGYSGENYVYWKTSSTSPDDNLDITGIVSVQECYTACKLNNNDNCWLFSYDPSNERCIVPDDDAAALTSVKRDDFEKQNVPGFQYYLFPVEEVAQDSIDVTLLPNTTFTDLVLYIGGTWDDDVSNLLMSGVDTVEHCYRICLITNNGICNMFSHHDVDSKCHIPHDSVSGRSTLVDLYGQSANGFTSYFMTDLSVPDLTIGYSGENYVYWKTSSSSPDDNLDITGIVSVQECYTACKLNNNDNCWLFSYEPTAKRCVVPDDDGAALIYTKRDDFEKQNVPGFQYYLFPVEEVAQDSVNVTLLPSTTFTDLVLYIAGTWDDDVSNLLMSGVDTVEHCYRICLTTNGGTCNLFSYNADDDKCHIPHDSPNSRTTLVDLYGQSSVGFTSYFMTDLYVPDLTIGYSGENYVYWKTSSSSPDDNLDIAGIVSVQECYTACKLNNNDKCWLFSYHPGDKRCVVPDDDGSDLIYTKRDDFEKQNVPGFQYYLFPVEEVAQADVNVTTLPSASFMDVVLYIAGTWNDDVSNLLMTGVDTVEHCYRICLTTNGGTCYLFSYNAVDDKCHIPHDSATPRTTLVNLYGQSSVGFTSYLMTDLIVPDLTIGYSGENYVYWKTSSATPGDNLDISGIVSVQQCYAACKLNSNNGKCWLFSYHPIDERCVVPNDDGADLTYDKRDDFQKEYTVGFQYYLFPVEEVAQDSIDVTLLPNTTFMDLVLYITGTWNDDDSNLLMTGVDTVEHCYRICLTTNGGTCYLFSYNDVDDKCHIPHDSPTSRTTLVDLYGQSSVGFTSYFMTDLSVPSLTIGYSGEDYVYWKTSSTSPDDNLDITGIVSVQECYTACKLNNNDKCWLFSYHPVNKRCVVPDDDGSDLIYTKRDDFQKEYTVGFQYYLFPVDEVAQSSIDVTSLSQTTFTDLVLYIAGTWNDDISNLLMSGVDTVEHCYRICLTTNGGTCHLFSYHPGSSLCHVPHDQPTSRTTLNDLYGVSSDGYTSYFMIDLSTPNLNTAYSGTGLAYWKTSSGHVADNLDITGITTVQKCYEACQLNTGTLCWAFSYVPTDKRCIVPDITGAALTYSIRTPLIRDTLSNAEYYLFPTYEVSTVSNLLDLANEDYTTLTGITLFIAGDYSWDDSRYNLLISGVTSAADCYKICQINNVGGKCFLFSYDATNDMCHVPDDNTPSRATIADLYGTDNNDYTSYFMADLSTPSLSTAYSGTGLAYWKTSSGHVVDNLDITGIQNAQDCYKACQLNTGSLCWVFSYVPTAERCVVPDITGAALAYSIRTPLIRDTLSNAEFYLFPTSEVSTVSNLLNLANEDYTTFTGITLFIAGDYSWDDSRYNLLISGVTSAADCYKICQINNVGGKCFLFSYDATNDMCHVPDDNVPSRATIADLYGTDNDDYTSYFMADLSTPSFTSDYSGSGLALWKTSTGHVADNLDITGIQTVQDCYKACQLNSGSLCWVFSYDAAAHRCIVPDLTSASLTYSIRTPLIMDTTLTNFKYYLYPPYEVSTVGTLVDLANEDYTTFSDVTFYISNAAWVELQYDLIISGVTSKESCYHICQISNGGDCFLFSYHAVDEICYIPDDSAASTRTTLEDVYGQDDNGYTSYVMRDLSTPTSFTMLSSGTDVLYWKGSVDNQADNLDITGISTVQECYSACELNNGGSCWLFSYIESSERCVVPDLSTSVLSHTVRSPLTIEQSEIGAKFYMFHSDALTDGGFTTDLLGKDYTTFDDNVLYLGLSWSSANENVLIANVDNAQKCYKICLATNNGYCFQFSYKSSGGYCHVPDDTATSRATPVGLKGISQPGYTSYFMQKRSSIPAFDEISSGDHLIYWRNNIDDLANNVDLLGIKTLSECYTVCQLTTSGSCWILSYHSSTGRCVVPLYDSQELTYGKRKGFQTESETNAKYYMYMEDMVATETTADVSAMSYKTFTNMVFSITSSYSATADNLIIIGVTDYKECYRICVVSNNGNCKMFSFNSGTCHVPDDSSSSSRTTIEDLYGTYVAGYTSYFMSSMTIPTFTTSVSQANVIYWRTGQNNVADNLDISSMNSLQECYMACKLNTNGNCWIFSYASGRCVVPDYNSQVLTYQQRTSYTVQSLAGANTYMFMDDVVTASVTTSGIDSLSYTTFSNQVLHTSGSWSDTNNNLIITGISTYQECYKICLVTNSNNCFFFSHKTGTCYVPHDASASTRNSISGITVSDVAGYTTYVMTDFSHISSTYKTNQWSSASGVIIYDGMSSSKLNVGLNGLADIQKCYKICTSTFGTCRIFSFDAATGNCHMADANFHDQWTSVSSNSAYTSYFLKDTSKYKMISKHVEYRGYHPHSTYCSTGSAHTDLVDGDFNEGTSYSSNQYLKNSLIDHWSNFGTKSVVRMEMKDSSGNLLKYIEYDATSTTSTDWFSSSNFLSSDLGSLTSGVTHNIWGIQCTDSDGRHFHISYQYNTCSGDAGWLSILSKVNSAACTWDATSSAPKFLYASGSNYATWQGGSSTFNTLVIKMKFS